MTKMLQNNNSKKISEGKVTRTIAHVVEDIPYCM